MLEKSFRILVVALSVGIVASPVARPLQAQSKPPDSASVRVRMESAETGETVAGLLIRADTNQLVIRPTASSASVDVKWEHLKRLEVSKGRASAGRRLGTRALVGGMVFGGLFGVLPCTDPLEGEECSSHAENYVGGALLGGIVGALSAIIPGRERWREIDANSVRSGATPDQWERTMPPTYKQRFSRTVKWAAYAGAATGVIGAATYTNDCPEDADATCAINLGDRVFAGIVFGWAGTALGSTVGALVAIVPTGGDRPAQKVSLTAPSLMRGQTGLGLALSW